MLCHSETVSPLQTVSPGLEKKNIDDNLISSSKMQQLMSSIQHHLNLSLHYNLFRNYVVIKDFLDWYLIYLKYLSGSFLL